MRDNNVKLQYTITNRIYMKNIYLFNKLTGINKYLKYNFSNANSNINFKLENDYILIVENDIKLKVLFSSFIKMEENEEYIYILNNFNNSIIVPKKIFGSFIELNEFREKVQKHINFNKKEFSFNIESFFYTEQYFNKLIGYLLPLLITLILILIELSVRKDFNFASIENICALIASILIITSMFSGIFYFISYSYIKKTKKFNKDIEYFNIEIYDNKIEFFNNSMSVEVLKNKIQKIKKDKNCLSININSYVINNVFLEKEYIDDCKKLLSKKRYFHKKIRSNKIPCKVLLIDSIVVAILPIILIAILGIGFYIFTWICYLLL